MKALFDTNILIDYLRQHPAARVELSRYADRAISRITWIEVMVGAQQEVAPATRAFLQQFAVVDLDERVAEAAVSLRRRHRLKLPDAIIWASAQAHGMLLVTRDTKDFPVDDPGIRVPY